MVKGILRVGMTIGLAAFLIVMVAGCDNVLGGDNDDENGEAPRNGEEPENGEHLGWLTSELSLSGQVYDMVDPEEKLLAEGTTTVEAWAKGPDVASPPVIAEQEFEEGEEIVLDMAIGSLEEEQVVATTGDFADQLGNEYGISVTADSPEVGGSRLNLQIGLWPVEREDPNAALGEQTVANWYYAEADVHIEGQGTGDAGDWIGEADVKVDLDLRRGWNQVVQQIVLDIENDEATVDLQTRSEPDGLEWLW